VICSEERMSVTLSRIGTRVGLLLAGESRDDRALKDIWSELYLESTVVWAGMLRP